tara:strand:+ start:224 stop:1039 length:816 start_codon:yes stop_codon:yes gene_type:complete
MFGPNRNYMSHRSNDFHSLLRDLRVLFKEKFQLFDKSVFFITGSGTLANEIVLSSLNKGLDIIGNTPFANDLGDLVNRYGKLSDVNNCKAIVHYDPRVSKIQKTINCDFLFVDMVSAFPYYEPYNNANIWTTVSSKQLGALPVISIIVIEHDSIKHIRKDDGCSCLNLMKYIEFSVKYETPHTPAIPLYSDLLKRLEKFDLLKFRQDINERRCELEKIIPEELIIGEGPVFTVDTLLPEKLGCYVSNGKSQIWLHNDKGWKQLYKELKCLF